MFPTSKRPNRRKRIPRKRVWGGLYAESRVFADVDAGDDNKGTERGVCLRNCPSVDQVPSQDILKRRGDELWGNSHGSLADLNFSWNVTCDVISRAKHLYITTANVLVSNSGDSSLPFPPAARNTAATSNVTISTDAMRANVCFCASGNDVPARAACRRH